MILRAVVKGVRCAAKGFSLFTVSEGRHGIRRFTKGSLRPPNLRRSRRPGW